MVGSEERRRTARMLSDFTERVRLSVAEVAREGIEVDRRIHHALIALAEGTRGV